MKSLKSKIEKVVAKPETFYYLFYRERNDRGWVLQDCHLLAKECEAAMLHSGEPESIEYMVIKGHALDYEEGPVIFPYYIRE